MSLAVHCQLNPQARPFVPTAIAPKLPYFRGRREGEEKPVNKHQILSRNGKLTVRRKVGRLNPCRETEIQSANREVSQGKADLRPRLFCFYESQQEAANG